MLAKDSWLDKWQNEQPIISPRSQRQNLQEMQQTTPVFATRKEGEFVDYEIDFAKMSDRYGDQFVALVNAECNYLIDKISKVNTTWLSHIANSILLDLDIDTNKIKRHIHNIRQRTLIGVCQRYIQMNFNRHVIKASHLTVFIGKRTFCIDLDMVFDRKRGLDDYMLRYEE